MLQGLVKPGDPARFAVIDESDGRRSSTWSVVTAKNTLDVIVMARCMGTMWHMSLHQSGDWHTGFTPRGAHRFVPGAETRHFDAWRRPEPFASGFHRGVQIVFPDSELRAWPEGAAESKSDRIVQVPAPGAGHVTVVELLFAPIGDWEPVEVIIEEGFRVATLERADHSTVAVVAIRQKWLESDHPEVAARKAEMVESVAPEWWETAAAPRAVALGVQDDGIRFVLDLALDVPSSIEMPSSSATRS
jgi:hypothetical protein